MSRLYSSLKFLAFPDHLDALRSKTVVAPLHIRIKPINRCNHNCWYCAYRVDNLDLGGDMVESDQIPADKMNEICDDVIAMGVKAVTFSGGGEPLLYKPLPEIITKLAKDGVRVATLTNGSNLRGRVADALAEHGTWVRISVDAWDDASYVASRGARDGDFSRLLENIRAFTTRGSKCVLGISFIVGKENHSHLVDICRMFKAAGVNHVKLSGVVVGNDAAANNAYHSGFRDAVAAQIATAQAELKDISFTILNHYHDLEDRFEKDYTTCPFLQFLTVIGADCTVYTCQDKAYTVSGTLGSIRDRSFRDFWFSEENRRTLHSFDPSQSCRHHCVSHSKNLTITNYLSIDPEHGLFV